MLKRSLMAAVFAAATMPTLALAQAGVTLEVMTEQVRIEDGVEVRSLVPAQSALPGDEIVYKLTVDNPDEIPAQDVELTLPINENITLAPYSFSSQAPYTSTFSVDGENFSEFSDLTVAVNGSKRAATAEDITHAMISINSVAPKTTAEVTYRAVVK